MGEALLEHGCLLAAPSDQPRVKRINAHGLGGDVTVIGSRICKEVTRGGAFMELRRNGLWAIRAP